MDPYSRGGSEGDCVFPDFDLHGPGGRPGSGRGDGEFSPSDSGCGGQGGRQGGRQPEGVRASAGNRPDRGKRALLREGLCRTACLLPER